jgi:hypothetical protein
MTEQASTKTRIEHYYKDEMFVPSWFSFPNLYSYVVEKFPSGSHFVEVGAWKARPQRITLPDAPAPTSKPLEKAYYATVQDIVDQVRSMTAS